MELIALDVIDTNTVVVYNATELKTVLEANNGYTYIYFGANITLTKGISISSSKATVILDGTYQNIRYTYEDMRSTASANTISAQSASIMQVTVKNMDVLGHNYYGLIYVPETSTLQNLVVEYNNIKYQGPQITYHPTGLSRYIDCTITILTSYAVANEVAECNRIEIGGNTTINHSSTGDSMFWYRGTVSPYFRVLSNAVVTITSEYRELFYGVNNLAFSILPGATFSLESHNGMGYNGYSTGKVLLDTNSTVTITQTASNGGYPTWYCNDSFIVNEGASLIMNCNYSGISTTNYNIYFRTTAASFVLNNPKYLLLYNSVADVIYTNSTISFSFQYCRINMWTKAAAMNIAGSLNDMPSYYWYKNQELSTVKGQILISSTVVLSNNYTTEELSNLFALSQFKFQGRKVISIGETVLIINPITDSDLKVTGIASSQADVQLSYNSTSQQVRADGTGNFSFSLDNQLPIGTKLSFIDNVAGSFLYKNKDVEIVYSGELLLSQKTQTITFSMVPYSINPVLCGRSSDLSLTVTDSRVYSTDWKLYANILSPLSSETGDVLTDSLVYVDSKQEITPLTQQLLLVYQGEKNSGTTKITVITFPDDEGVLLRIMNEPIKNGVIYYAKIIWTLEE